MNSRAPYPNYSKHDRVTFNRLPDHWQVARGRHLVEITTGSGDTVNATPDGDYPFYVRSDQPLLSDQWEFDTTAVLTAGDGAGVAKVFHLVSGRFMAHQRVYVLSKFHRVTPEFFYYAFGSMFRLMALDGSARSTVDSVRRSMIADMAFPVPPLDEQRAISDFLDRETARIDTLIDEQQRLVELFQERRDSEWTSLLNKAGTAGPALPLKRLLDSIVDGPFGSSLTSAHYSDDGARVIRLGNIGINVFRNHDIAHIPLDYANQLAAHSVQSGDVVIAGLGDDKMPLGRAAVVPDIGPAIVKADCYRARPKAHVSPAYMAWALSAPPTRDQIMLLARGATRARLNTSVVQQVEIPLPARKVQVEIIEQWLHQAGQIDALIAETEKFVELSRERRTALITAAVTGQIDVRQRVS